MPTTVTGWSWWIFSVLIIGFLINLASGYAKPRLDAILGRLSERKRLKNQHYQTKVDEDAARILASSSEQEYFYFDYTGTYVRFYGIITATLLAILFSGTLLLAANAIKLPTVASPNVNFADLPVEYRNALILWLSILILFGISVAGMVAIRKVTRELEYKGDVRKAIRKLLDELLEEGTRKKAEQALLPADLIKRLEGKE